MNTFKQKEKTIFFFKLRGIRVGESFQWLEKNMVTHCNSLTADIHTTCCRLSPSSTKGQSWVKNTRGGGYQRSCFQLLSSCLARQKRRNCFFKYLVGKKWKPVGFFTLVRIMEPRSPVSSKLTVSELKLRIQGLQFWSGKRSSAKIHGQIFSTEGWGVKQVEADSREARHKPQIISKLWFLWNIAPLCTSFKALFLNIMLNNCGQKRHFPCFVSGYFAYLFLLNTEI